MAKYAMDSMRPVYRFLHKALKCDYVLVIQETDVKYLLLPIDIINDFKTGFNEIKIGHKTWRSKKTTELLEKVGEIRVSGWDNEIEGGKQALYNIISGTLEDEEEIIEEININDNDFETCKFCGYVGNSVREDGIIRCKHCGTYYT